MLLVIGTMGSLVFNVGNKTNKIRDSLPILMISRPVDHATNKIYKRHKVRQSCRLYLSLKLKILPFQELFLLLQKLTISLFQVHHLYTSNIYKVKWKQGIPWTI